MKLENAGRKRIGKPALRTNGVLCDDTPFSFLALASLKRLLAAVTGSETDAGVLSVYHALRSFLRSGDLEDALRLVDRACRTLPAESVGALIPIYGYLFFFDGRDPVATLGMLQRAEALAADSDIAALKAYACLNLNRPDLAYQYIESALAAYCADANGMLAYAASRTARHPEIDMPGWVGRGPKLSLIGELFVSDRSPVLDIQIGSSIPFSQSLPSQNGSNPRFNYALAPAFWSEKIGVALHGAPLLGSGATLPPEFAIDGRAVAKGSNVRGWATFRWAPHKRVRLRVSDSEGNHVESRVERHPNPGWRWPFCIDLREHQLRGNRFELAALGPDSEWYTFPDAPLFLRPFGKTLGVRGHLGRWQARRKPRRRQNARSIRPVYIAIPVFGNRQATLSCVGSVLEAAESDLRVVVIDDASEDPLLTEALLAYRDHGRIELIRNTHNLGFVASANRVMRLYPDEDVVLLNSDTLVFGDWVKRLQDAAYSGERVGTVTPFSNNGSIASYPTITGSTVSALQAVDLDSLAATVLPGTSIEIPVGVGFCLYIKRDCLLETGYLDEEVFGHGYGEEVDFCLRARQRGWSHHLAANVYVLHEGGTSFGRRRQALLERSQRLINLRYPGYDAHISDFLRRDPAGIARRRLDEERLFTFDADLVLIVTLALDGGVERFVRERRREINTTGLHVVVLKPTASGESSRCELLVDALNLTNLRYDTPREIPEIVGLLSKLRVRKIEIQHFLHINSLVIEAILRLRVPYTVFIHDYSWFCPRITLIDEKRKYCGEPSLDSCEVCVKQNGSELGETLSVRTLRKRSALWLGGASCISAPSNDTAIRIQRHFPGLRVDVRPHASTINEIAIERRSENQCARVALIGAIGKHKGYDILLRCAREARARRLPIEFVVIGHTHDDSALMATNKVFVTGQYAEAEAAHLVQRERPDIAWFPSVWPETWCYALDYAIAANLMIVAYDLGAIAERLISRGACELIPLGMAAASINDRLMRAAERTRREHRDRASQENIF